MEGCFNSKSKVDSFDSVTVMSQKLATTWTLRSLSSTELCFGDAIHLLTMHSGLTTPVGHSLLPGYLTVIHAKSQMTVKRIQREISDLKKENLGSIVLEPTENLQVWRGIIPGPQGSVYEGGMFKVEIQLPNDYPFVFCPFLPVFAGINIFFSFESFSAPKVTFKTK